MASAQGGGDSKLFARVSPSVPSVCLSIHRASRFASQPGLGLSWGCGIAGDGYHTSQFRRPHLLNFHCFALLPCPSSTRPSSWPRSPVFRPPPSPPLPHLGYPPSTDAPRNNTIPTSPSSFPPFHSLSSLLPLPPVDLALDNSPPGPLNTMSFPPDTLDQHGHVPCVHSPVCSLTNARATGQSRRAALRAE